VADVISGKVDGLNLVISGIDSFGVRARAYALVGVTEGLKKAAEASRKMVGATDHSLAALAQMGHPYSTAHPAPPHSDPIVHVQTGAYLNDLTVNSPRGTSAGIISGSISVEGSSKELDRWLQDGTSKMIARPWMKWVVEKFGQDILGIIKARIQEALRSDRAA
jgi:hypothetical protein